MKKTISVCMIIRNEAAVLERCLLAASQFADELIVVDTGSTDASREIAAAYTDQVYDFTWRDDFAAARNYAFSLGQSDYLMWLDADDVVDACNVGRILEWKETVAWPDAVTMLYDRPENGALVFYVRMVRRKPEICWYGPIHERLVGYDSTEQTDIVIRHAKEGSFDLQRNIRMMQNLTEEHFLEDFWLCGQCILDCCVAGEKELAERYLVLAGRSRRSFIQQMNTYPLIGDALRYHKIEDMAMAWGRLFLTDLESGFQDLQTCLERLPRQECAAIQHMLTSYCASMVKCCGNAGRTEEAYTYNEAALRIDPEDVIARLNRMWLQRLCRL